MISAPIASEGRPGYAGSWAGGGAAGRGGCRTGRRAIWGTTWTEAKASLILCIFFARLFTQYHLSRYKAISTAMMQVAISKRLNPLAWLSLASVTKPMFVWPCFLIPCLPVATSDELWAPILVDLCLHQLFLGSIRILTANVWSEKIKCIMFSYFSDWKNLKKKCGMIWGRERPESNRNISKEGWVSTMQTQGRLTQISRTLCDIRASLPHQQRLGQRYRCPHLLSLPSSRGLLLWGISTCASWTSRS